MNQNSLFIGNSKTEQITLFSKINQNYIEKILLKKIDLLENLMNNSNDYYLIEIIKGLIERKKIVFNLNKHEEIYCNFVKKDFDKLIKYIIFRI